MFIKCGIPLGGQIVELCKIHAFIKNEISQAAEFLKNCPKQYDINELREYLITKGEQGNYEKYLEKKHNDLKSIIDQNAHLKRIKAIFGEFHEGDKDIIWKNFENSILEDSQYGFWMDEYSEDPLERQKLIEKLIDDKQPNGAYILLAYMIEQMVFTNLLTTNFDDLINEALIYYTEKRCRFYADDEISQYISIHSKKPNIIKVHGDYRYANIRNTNDETDKLSENIGIKLKELLSQLGLIVVGYNGADHSIMSVLYEIKKYCKYPLIWCGQHPDKVHWRVAQLINVTPNSYFVQIEGFDEMIGQLAPSLFKKRLEYNFLDKAKKRVKEVEDYLNTFKIAFKSSNVSEEEKENLEITLDKWDLFNQACDIEDPKEQIKLYSKAIVLDDKFSVAYNNRGNAFMLLHQFEEAIKDFNKAISIQPTDANFYHNRGNAFKYSNNFDSAKQDYERYKEIEGEDSDYFNSIADLFNRNGRTKEALEWANQGLQRFPKDAFLIGTLAEVYGQMKEKENFYVYIEKAINLGYPIEEIINRGREDYIYQQYKTDAQFIELMNKYHIAINTKLS